MRTPLTEKDTGATVIPDFWHRQCTWEVSTVAPLKHPFSLLNGLHEQTACICYLGKPGPSERA